MIRLLASLVALSWTLDAAACECAFSPLNERAVVEAKSVVVFQLLGAELGTDDAHRPGGRRVIGDVRVVEVLRGDVDLASVEYSTNWCCGTRLDVGHFYALFSDSTEPGPFVHPGNLLPLGESYYPRNEGTSRLRQVTDGHLVFSEHFGEYPSERLFQVPLPPPPCPQE